MNTKALGYGASVIAALTAVLITAAILDRFAGVTVIDVGALFTAGALAGLFLGLGLNTGRAIHYKRQDGGSGFR